MARVVVVGGGIAGLAAAHALTAGAARPGEHQVIVLERSGRPGGALRTGQLGGLDLEEGADAFLLRTPEAADLARAVGCPLRHPATGRALVYAAGRLRPLPAGTVLGVPGGLRGLRPVLGGAGVLRAGLDRLMPPTRLPADPSVGQLVRGRLGRRVLDRLVDPLLGGVYAGSADGLSVRATVPALADPGRSLLATVAARRPAPQAGPVFGSVPGGLGALAAAVAGAVRAGGGEIRTGVTVTGLAREGPGWAVRTGPVPERGSLPADAVVLALPAGSAARLLAGLVPQAALPDTRYASVAVVTLLYPPGTPTPPASGVLVAGGAGLAVKAVTFVGRKWGHPADAPVVVRASVGRYGAERDLQRPDAELAGLVAAEVGSVTGIDRRPAGFRVTRWGGALPQYTPGHLDRVSALRAALPGGLAVCGAGFDGVGISACVRSGQAAARAAAAGRPGG